MTNTIVDNDDWFDSDKLLNLWSYFRMTNEEALRQFPVVSKEMLERTNFIRLVQIVNDNTNLYDKLVPYFYTILLPTEKERYIWFFSTNKRETFLIQKFHDKIVILIKHHKSMNNTSEKVVVIKFDGGFLSESVKNAMLKLTTSSK